MKCIECGHELKDGAVFCIRCGAMQVKSAQATEANTAPVRPAVSNKPGAGGRQAGKSFTPAPKRSTASIVVPIVAVVAALCAVGALAVFVLNPGSSGKSSGAASQAAVATSSESASDSTASSTSSDSTASSATSTSSASSASSTTSTTSSTSAASASSESSASASSTSTTTNTSVNNTPTIVEEEQPTYDYSYDDSYYMWDTSDRYYTQSDVDNMSNYDLYFARNEIYARHGRMFNNSDLQDYFNSKSWYNPTYTPEQFDSMASPLSDVEQKNCTLMLQEEQSRNSPYV